MEAVEFSTHSDGNVIRIPPGHNELLNKDLRVIILFDEIQKRGINKEKRFKAVHLKTKNFKFSRDEVNER